MIDMLKAVPVVASSGSSRRKAVWRVVLAVVLTLIALGLIALPFVLAGTNAYRKAFLGKANLEAAEMSINAL